MYAIAQIASGEPEAPSESQRILIEARFESVKAKLKSMHFVTRCRSTIKHVTFASTAEQRSFGTFQIYPRKSVLQAAALQAKADLSRHILLRMINASIGSGCQSLGKYLASSADFAPTVSGCCDFDAFVVDIQPDMLDASVSMGPPACLRTAVAFRPGLVGASTQCTA